MRIFKVSACGNNAEEALHAAIVEDNCENKNSGIQTKTKIQESDLTEREVNTFLSSSPPIDSIARYIYLGGGEYLFFGATEE
jgi:hypothetical protein